MPESAHKYYCIYCHQFLLGDTAITLAVNVNNHNAFLHPLDCSTWSSTGIVRSAQYVGAEGPIPEYLKPSGATPESEWGDAKNPPKITEKDRTLLAAGGVRWD